MPDTFFDFTVTGIILAHLLEINRQFRRSVFTEYCECRSLAVFDNRPYYRSGILPAEIQHSIRLYFFYFFFRWAISGKILHPVALIVELINIRAQGLGRGGQLVD